MLKMKQPLCNLYILLNNIALLKTKMSFIFIQLLTIVLNAKTCLVVAL